jgi:hypothetical protein
MKFLVHIKLRLYFLSVNKIQIKFKLSLCLIKHYNIKTNGVVDMSFSAFSAIALDGDKWSTSPPSPAKVTSELGYETLATTGQAAGGIQSPYGHYSLENSILRWQGIEP